MPKAKEAEVSLPAVGSRDALIAVSIQLPGGEMGKTHYIKLEEMAGAILGNQQNDRFVLGHLMAGCRPRICKDAKVIA